MTTEILSLLSPVSTDTAFTTASRTLGTQMKATGEVMAIGNSFEGALMKAIRSLELVIPEEKGKDQW